MYEARINYRGDPFFVLDEDAADEISDFQESVCDCIDSMIDALDDLKDVISSFPVPASRTKPDIPKSFPEWTPPTGDEELPF